MFWWQGKGGSLCFTIFNTRSRSKRVFFFQNSPVSIFHNEYLFCFQGKYIALLLDEIRSQGIYINLIILSWKNHLHSKKLTRIDSWRASRFPLWFDSCFMLAVQTIRWIQRAEWKCCLYTLRMHFSSWRNSISSNRRLTICLTNPCQHLFCRIITIIASSSCKVHVQATQKNPRNTPDQEIMK